MSGTNHGTAGFPPKTYILIGWDEMVATLKAELNQGDGSFTVTNTHAAKLATAIAVAGEQWALLRGTGNTVIPQ